MYVLCISLHYSRVLPGAILYRLKWAQLLWWLVFVYSVFIIYLYFSYTWSTIQDCNEVCLVLVWTWKKSILAKKKYVRLAKEDRKKKKKAWEQAQADKTICPRLQRRSVVEFGVEFKISDFQY